MRSAPCTPCSRWPTAWLVPGSPRAGTARPGRRMATPRVSCLRWWPRRPATRSRCSTWAWTWRPTWASTRSSASRSWPPSKSACPTWSPLPPTKSGPCAPWNRWSNGWVKVPPRRRRPPQLRPPTSPPSFWRWWPRRPATRSRCSTWAWTWRPTWASTRSSASRSWPPSKSACPTSSPSPPTRSAPCTPCSRWSNAWVERRLLPAPRATERLLPARARCRRPSWQWWLRRPATRWRCSTWTWTWRLTWASTRSSASRSWPPSKSACPTSSPSLPMRSAPCAPCARSSNG